MESPLIRLRWQENAREQLANGDLVIRPDGVLTLARRAVGSSELGRHVIESRHIDSNSITSRTIKDGTVTGDDLADTLSLGDVTVRDGLTVEGDTELSGNLSVTGIITGAFSGAFAPSGDVDMTTHLLTNIGDNGTDFTSTGGLTLADTLTVSGGGASITGTLTLPSLTQGSIPFIGASGTLSEDPANLYWDGTNHRLGIGTGSPVAVLDVNGDALINGILVGRGLVNSITNTVIGDVATTFANNISGYSNVALGYQSMQSNTTGYYNTALGRAALNANQTGIDNTAVGTSALQYTTSQRNTAVGFRSLFTATTGSYNVALGVFAGSTATTGGYNTIIGSSAQGGTTGSYNTAIGYGSGSALTSGSKNTILGSFSGNSGGLDIRASDNYIVLSDGDGNFRQVIDGSGNVGIGDTTPASLLTVGNGDLFQVDSTGNLIKVRNVTYSWPSSQGSASTVLTNNGSGTLSWGTLGASSITADSLDFTELKDALTLDASTDISITGTNVFSLTNTGTGNSFVVNDEASDTTPFVIDASGNVGIGTGSPASKLSVANAVEYDQLTLAYDGTYYSVLGTDSGGNLNLNPSGNNVVVGSWADGKILAFPQRSNGTPGNSASMRADWDNFYLTNTNGMVIIENAVDESHGLGIQEAGSPWDRVSWWYDGSSATGTGMWFHTGSSAGGINFRLGEAAGASDFKVLDNSSNVRLLVNSLGNVGIGTSSPSYKLDISGTTRTPDLLSQDIVLSASSNSILTAYKGFRGYTNFSGGIGTGGSDSLTPATRLTSAGNLVNIGSIQAGETKLTSAGTFAAKVDYAAGSSPISVASSDFNADGMKDLAVLNYFGETISIFLNNGNGTFATKVDYVTRVEPYYITSSDFNGDGYADLAAVSGDSFLSIFINNGDGTFASKVDYSTGSGPFGIASADLNGDGKADLAVVNSNSNTVSVFINQGNGTFAPKVDYSAGTSPSGISSADLNGDGRLDMAVTNMSDNTVSVFINQGDGTFASKVDYSTGSGPFGIASADLNGDGKADLAVVNYNSATVSTFMNNGDGTLATKADYTTGSRPQGVALADFNGDGKLDITTANFFSNSVSVFINAGDGTFAPKVDYTTGLRPQSVVSSDFNSDGKPDIATANQNDGFVSVLLNTPQTMFYAQASTGRIGIGDTSPAALLTVGSGDLFQVNSSGAIAAAAGITSSGTITFSGLTAGGVVSAAAGTGVLSVGTIGASGITADSLDFTEFQDTLDLDAALTVNQTTNTWSQTFTGTTTTGLSYAADSLTTGTALAVSSTSTAGDASKLLTLTRSGANGTSTKTNYGLYSTITNTGTSSTNVAGYFSASGATNNYGLVVAAGNVGVGTTTPTAKLESVADTVTTTGSELAPSMDLWTYNADCSSYAAGKITTTYDATCQAGSNDPEIHTSITFTTGHTYVVTFTLESVSGDTVNPYIKSVSYSFGNQDYTNGTYSWVFTAANDATDLWFEPWWWSTNGTWTISAISVKEANESAPALVLTDYDSAPLLSIGGTAAIQNLSIGRNALAQNTTGVGNVAIGENSLYSNTTGGINTATGFSALKNNTSGYGSSAFGTYALMSNTTGLYNSAFGKSALASNTTGGRNTASGLNTLANNTTGSYNTASGMYSLLVNTTGSNNTAAGYYVLGRNTAAANSVAMGYQAGYGSASYSNTGGTYLGYRAGYSAGASSNYNTLVGYQSGYDITTGTDNLILGSEQTVAGGITTGSNNILLGKGVRYGLTQTGSNQLNIGNLIFATGLGSENTLSTGSVGIGTAAPSAKLEVVQDSATVAAFNRTTNDGTIISLQQAGTEEGTISVSGTTVSYNAFTGSHYALSALSLDTGTLVSLNGANQRFHGDPQSEIIYGIDLAQEANSPTVLGAYLGLQDESRTRSLDNPDLIMAVGNGEMWIVDRGQGDISTGDYLISSDVAGYAMKDSGTYEVSNVIARAAESIDWKDVTDKVGNRKRKKISVFFENFSKVNPQIVLQGTEDRLTAAENSITDIQASIDGQGASIADLSSRTDTLEAGVQTLLSFYSALSLDTLLMKDTDGNLDLEDGTLLAKRVETEMVDTKDIATDSITVRDNEDSPTLGTAEIKAGETEVIVETGAVTEQSRIFLTPETAVAFGVKKDTENKTFTVSLSQAAPDDISFSWWIVESGPEAVPAP